MARGMHRGWAKGGTLEVQCMHRGWANVFMCVWGGGEGLGHNKGRAFVGREGQPSTSKAVQCTCWRSTRAKVVLAGLSPDAPSTTPIQLWLPEAWDWHEPSSPGKGLLCPAQSQLFAMHNVTMFAHSIMNDCHCRSTTVYKYDVW